MQRARNREPRLIKRRRAIVNDTAAPRRKRSWNLEACHGCYAARSIDRNRPRRSAGRDERYGVSGKSWDYLANDFSRIGEKYGIHASDGLGNFEGRVVTGRACTPRIKLSYCMLAHLAP